MSKKKNPSLSSSMSNDRSQQCKLFREDGEARLLLGLEGCAAMAALREVMPLRREGRVLFKLQQEHGGLDGVKSDVDRHLVVKNAILDAALECSAPEAAFKGRRFETFIRE